MLGWSTLALVPFIVKLRRSIDVCIFVVRKQRLKVSQPSISPNIVLCEVICIFYIGVNIESGKVHACFYYFYMGT